MDGEFFLAVPIDYKDLSLLVVYFCENYKLSLCRNYPYAECMKIKAFE